MEDKIALITVTINHSVLPDFLKSLEAQKNKNYHLFLVDITDEKKDITAPGINVTVIPSENRGYSYGVNQGIQKAVSQGYTKFCILNDDIFFKDDFVGKILSAAKKYPNSIIAGKIYYAPGYEYHKDRYTKKDLGHVLWYAGGLIDWAHAIAKHRGVDEVDRKQYDKIEETDFVNGCLMVYDQSVLHAVGAWDESYFLYFEDADFSERAKKQGIKLMYEPAIKIWHKVSQSTGGSGSNMHRIYQSKNRVRFGLKFAPFRTKLHLIKNYLLGRV